MNRGVRAFPIGYNASTEAFDQYPGMYLRDYFAAHAMQGLMANPEVSGTNSSLAADAYAMADQMM